MIAVGNSRMARVSEPDIAAQDNGRIDPSGVGVIRPTLDLALASPLCRNFHLGLVSSSFCDRRHGGASSES